MPTTTPARRAFGLTGFAVTLLLTPPGSVPAEEPAPSGSGHARRMVHDGEPVSCVCFNPDGNTLAVGGQLSREVRLWDTTTGKERGVLTTQGMQAGDVFSLAYNPDGKTLAAGLRAGVLVLWKMATGEVLTTAEIGKPRKEKGGFALRGHVYAVQFSPDGKAIAAASGDTLSLCDGATGQELRSFTGHTNSVYDLAFSPDGKTLATGSATGEVVLWDVATGKPRLPGK